MQFESRKQNNATIVAIKGRMDVIAAMDFEKKFAALIEGGDRKFVLDLIALEYISSAGLRGILAVAKQVEKQKGQLRICNLKGTVKDVFAMTGFDAMLSVMDSLDQALA